MTHDEWRRSDELAIELNKLLENPVMKHAVSVLETLTAAKAIGGTPQLYTTNNAHVLFGFDAGRASILNDLQQLARVPEEIVAIEPSYQGEF